MGEILAELAGLLDPFVGQEGIVDHLAVLGDVLYELEVSGMD